MPLLLFPSAAFAAPGFMDAQRFVLEAAGLTLAVFYLGGLAALLSWRRRRETGRPVTRVSTWLFFSFPSATAAASLFCLLALRSSAWVMFLSAGLWAVLAVSVLFLAAFGSLRLLERTRLAGGRRMVWVYNLALLAWLGGPAFALGKYYLHEKSQQERADALRKQIGESKAACEGGAGERCVRVFQGMLELSYISRNPRDYDEGVAYLKTACEKGAAAACKDFVFRTGLSGKEADAYFARGCRLHDDDACERAHGPRLRKD
jgi:hypothetical protein